MTTRWFGALLITATALTPIAAPVFAANAATVAMMVRDDVAVRDGADRAVRPVQARVMAQVAPTTPAAGTSPNFQDRRDGGGRHGGGNHGGGNGGGGGGGGGWGGGNRGSSSTATPAPAPAPRADRSGGGQWQGRADRGGYGRPAAPVDSNAGGNVQYQRRGYDRPATSPTPNAGADIQYQRRGGDAGAQRGDQGRTGGYDRGGYNRGGDQNRGGGVVVTQPAPRYDRQRTDARRTDNRGYENRGYDNRGYDNHGRDDRRYDNRGNDGRRYDNRHDNGRYGNGHNNGYASWNQGWRNDRRYDWVNYRARYGSQFSLGRYYVPYRNWNYRRLTIGFSLWPLFYSDRYWINDPWSYRLPDVYGPYRWVRYYDDAILVDVETGEVVDTIYDFFW